MFVYTATSIMLHFKCCVRLLLFVGSWHYSSLSQNACLTQKTMELCYDYILFNYLFNLLSTFKRAMCLFLCSFWLHSLCQMILWVSKYVICKSALYFLALHGTLLMFISIIFRTNLLLTTSGTPSKTTRLACDCSCITHVRCGPRGV